MSRIGLTRVTHLIPFARFVEQTGAATEPLVERVHLPVDCLTRPEMHVPTHCIREFRELAARSLGLPNIALDATQNLTLEQLGRFGRLLAHAGCLYQALAEFCSLVSVESSCTVMKLKEGEECFWLTHRALDKQPDQWNSELYVLHMLLWMVRLSVPNWSPAHTDVCFAATPDRRAALRSLGCESATFGAEYTAFALPRSMLALPFPMERRKEELAPVDRKQFMATAPATTMAESLAQALRSYRQHAWAPISNVAEIAGVSVRTLQRRFRQEGMSFSSFVEKSRFDHAIALLTTTDMAMSDIAAELGYSRQANFTRAFRRWAGVTPREFRRQRTAS